MTTTLLAVDDSVTMRKVLELTFAGEGFRVVTVDSADAALAKLRSERPALVLADVTLEGTNGYTLCQKIKAESPTTPVIVLSSRQQPYDAAKGSAAKADDFIDKPFDTQQLIDKVKKALGQAVAAPASPFASSRSASSWTAASGAPGAPRPAPAAPAAPAGLRHTPPPAAVVMPPQASRRPIPAAESRPASAPSRPAAPAFGAPKPSGAPARAPSAVPSAPVMPAAPVAAPKPAAPAAAPSAAPAPAPAAAAVALPADLASKLSDLGLTEAQVTGVLALSREVVERVVWEVVPVLAETMIKEEIARLTAE